MNSLETDFEDIQNKHGIRFLLKNIKSCVEKAKEDRNFALKLTNTLWELQLDE